jgi:hypothetical protein
LQIKVLIVENTFMSVEDMVSQVLPPLGAVIGTGKPLNCLVTNKWRNLAEIERITQLPLLLMASVHVSGCTASTAAAGLPAVRVRQRG